MTSKNDVGRIPYLPPEATCFIRDFSSEYEEVAACVPNEGLLLYREGQVIGWCDVGDDPVKHIAIFFTYQPCVKHYILQLESEVKVVSHNAHLKVTHTFEDVVKFEIGDFNQKGYPQLALWHDNAKSPHITDLAVSCPALSANPVERVLSTKLEGMKVSLDKVQYQLEEKKKLKRLCMFHILGTDYSNNSNQCLKLIPLLGKAPRTSGGVVDAKLFKHTLAINNTWQRMLSGNWILGCDVQNNGSLPLRSLSLCVSGPRPPRPPRPPQRVGGVLDEAAAAQRSQRGSAVRWRVMVHDPPQSPRPGSRQRAWPLWRTLPADGVLEPGQRASIIAMVPEPTFSGRSPWLDMSGVVKATLPDGRETWRGVPRWRLSVDAVLRGALLPFQEAECHEDLLASLACSAVRLDLRLEGRPGLSRRVASVLSDAHLRPPGPAGGGEETPADTSVLVGRGPLQAPLHGALVKMDVLASTACALRLCVRELRHAFLLVHRLLDGLPQHTTLSVDSAGRASSASSASSGEELQRALVRALDAELRAVSARTPRAALHPLEINTDLAAAALRLSQAEASDEM